MSPVSVTLVALTVPPLTLVVVVAVVAEIVPLPAVPKEDPSPMRSAVLVSVPGPRLANETWLQATP